MTDNFSRFRLARQLVILTVVFSSLITLVITAYQLYENYRKDISVIEGQLDEFSKVHLQSLTRKLWTADKQEAVIHLEGIISAPEVKYIRINDENNNLWVDLGQPQKSHFLSRLYPMEYSYRGKKQKIGTLYIEVSFEQARQRVYDQLWTILVSNAIKTFLVTVFILFVFYHLVTRHLNKINDHLVDWKLGRAGGTLKLDRKKNKKDDELDVLVNAISANEKMISTSMNELNYYKYAVDQHSMVSVTDTEGLIIYANDLFCEVSGYPLSELVGRTHKIVNSGLHAESFFQDLWQKITAGKLWKGDICNVSKDGELFWSETTIVPHFDDYNKTDKYIALRSNITERKKIQALHDRQAKRWKRLSEVGLGISGDSLQVLSQICQMLAELLMLDGVYLYEVVNDNSKLLTAWQTLNLTDDNSLLEQHLNMIIAVKQGRDFSLVNQGQDIRVYCLPILNHENEVIAILCMAKNNPLQLATEDEELIALFLQRIASEIEYRLAADEQEDLERQLHQSQKMEALGLLAGGIAHDFNNMLAAILGYSYLAKQTLQQQETNKDALEYINQVNAAGERARDLIKQMMMFSRTEDSEVTQVNIELIVKEVMRLIRATLPASLSIDFNYEASLPMISASPVSIYQIVMNLCVNARDAMQGKGSLQISIAKAECKDQICDACKETFSGTHVLLAIQDQGDGISADLREKIFAPFFSTKSKTRGTGRGLATVNKLTHRYDGHIILKSDPQDGSCFEIYFPVTESQHKHHSDVLAMTDANEPAVIKGKHALVVDDEMSVARMHGQLLESMGCQVTVTTDPVEAFRLVKEKPELFDVIVTDQTMPLYSGSELAEKILAICPDMPIIICTGYSETFTEEQATAMGIKSYLLKPVSMTTLREAVITNLSDSPDD